jgi:outer membrane protein OmpA-like peptidoglycan-associated protein
MKSLVSIIARRPVVFCLALLLSPFLLLSQNLVQNPSFETIAAGKTIELENPIDIAAGWSAPNEGKSLLYTTSGEHIYDPNGSLWPFKARSGKNVAGMNVFGDHLSGAARREYIQGTLISPLTVGKKYFFQFWVHYHCEGANNIGIAFLPEKIKDTTGGLLHFQPVSFQKEVTLYDNGRNMWTLVRDSFVAVRPFRNFVIGNFFPDSLTKIEANTYDHHFAFIDDILVVEVPNQSATQLLITKEEEEKWDENVTVSKGMQTATKNGDANTRLVFFKFASATITPETAALLDGIAAELGQNSNATIELKGFASSEGSMAYNKQLSKRRNQSVRNYLTAKGIAASRISMTAFGEDNPADTNDTEEGRSKNRRVEVGWSVE